MLRIILAVVAATASLLLSAEGAVLSNLIPQQGSLMGGTRVTVLGSGFMRGGIEGSTTVYFGSDLCKTIDYYSTDNQLVCDAPPSSTGGNLDAFVRISLVSMIASEFASVVSINPYFYYRDYRTPQILSMARGGSSGDLFWMYGALFVNDISKHDARVAGSVCDLGVPGQYNANPPLSNAPYGTLRCALAPQPAGYYNLSLRVDDSDYGYGFPRIDRSIWDVTPDGNTVYNVQQFPVIERIWPSEGGMLGGSMLTIVGRGFTDEATLNLGVTAKMTTRILVGGGVPCDVVTSSSTQIVCVLGSAAPIAANFSSLSSNYYSTLTSTGVAVADSLENTTSTVFIRNGTQVLNPSTTTNSSTSNATLCFHPLSTENIPCSDTPLWNRRLVYAGSRGLTVRRWSNSGWGDRLGGLTRPPTSMRIEALGLAEGTTNEDNFQQQYDGFFRPAVSGNYTFYARGDDWADVYLSSNERPQNLSRVAVSPWYTSSYWQAPGQISDKPIYLEAGRRYYMRVFYHENGGGEYIQIAARVRNISSSFQSSWWTELQQQQQQQQQPAAGVNTTSSSNGTLPPPTLTRGQLLYQTPTERQIVSVLANVSREVQVVNVTGVAGGSFRLQCVSALSDPLSWDSSASTVGNAAGAIMPGCSWISASRTAVMGLVASVSNSSNIVNTVIGYSYQFTINCATAVDFPMLSAVNNNLQTANGRSISLTSARIVRASKPVSGTFRLGTPQGGSVVWTGPIPFNAGTGQVIQALQLLPGFTQVDCESWGNSPDGGSWRILFLAPRQDWPQLLVDTGSSGASNGTSNVFLDGPPGVTMTVTTEEDGSASDLWLDPLPGDLFEVAEELPPVQLWINGMKAACQRDVAGVDPISNIQGALLRGGLNECAFLYRESLTPQISAIVPNISAGVTLSPGQNITLFGTNLGGFWTLVLNSSSSSSSSFATSAGAGVSGLVTFNSSQTALLNSVSVQVGPASCIVVEVASDGSRVVCRLDDAPAGDLPVTATVHYRGGGIARSSLGSSAAVRVAINVSSIIPSTGGVMGGQTVTIVGSGLGTNLAVAFGVNATCNIVSAGNPWRRIVCITPSRADATANGAVVDTTTGGVGTSGVAVTVFSSADANSSNIANVSLAVGAFVYSEALTSNLTLVSPATISSGITTILTLNGSFYALNFSDPSQFEILVAGNKLCSPLANRISATSIQCRLERSAAVSTCASQQASALQLRLRDTGLARSPSATTSLTVDLALRVTSFSPSVGSLAGGTTITIFGAGFADIKGSVLVSFAAPPPPPATGSSNSSSSDRPLTTTTPTPLPSVACNVTSSNWTQIVCVTMPVDQSWMPSSNNSASSSSLSISTPLQVQVNGIAAVCCSNASPPSCNFTFSQSRTPSVTNITPTQAIGGSLLTITGTLFDQTSVGGSVLVRVGVPDALSATVLAADPARGASDVAADATSTCSVQTVSSTQIVCQLPFLPAGRRSVSVGIVGVGLADSRPVFRHLLQVTSLSPSRGSAAGGQIVTLSGSGLSRGAVSALFGASALGNVLWNSDNFTSMLVLVPAPTVSISLSSLNVTLNVSALEFTDTFDMCGGQTGRQVVYSNACFVTGSDGSSVACFYMYDTTSALTPQVTSRTYAAGYRGTVITIAGTGFGSNYSASSTVEIGGASCAVNASAWSDTSIQCTVGDTPAGNHLITVYVDGKGLARYSTSAGAIFPSLLEVTSIWPSVGSFAGGSLVTMRGRGFATNSSSSSSSAGAAGATTVAFTRAVSAASTSTLSWICNANCTMVSSSYDTLVCRTAPLGLIESTRTFGLAPASLLTGRIFGLTGSSSNWNLAFDGDIETTMFLSSSSPCNVGIELPIGTTAQLTSIMYYPRYRNAALMQNGRFEASVDGVTWFTVFNITARVQESWNTQTFAADGSDLPPAVQRNARFFRYVGAPNSGCQLNEIQFNGIRTSSDARVQTTANGNFTAGCFAGVNIVTLPSPVAAVSAASTRSNSLTTGIGLVQSFAVSLNSTASDFFVYDSLSTPVISSIEPNNATAIGGTTITLRGRGFGTVAANLTIVLHGYPCTVSGVVSDTLATCVTSPRQEIRPASPSLRVDPVGSAAVMSGVRFRYLDLWSSLTTWLNFEPPVEGDTVIVPEGQAVLLDVSPPRLRVLAVLGELVFDTRVDITLNATYILINGGVMSIGTEENPYTNRKVTVTLHGDRYKDIEVPMNAGAKTIAVYNRRMLQPRCGARTHFHDFDMNVNSNTIRGSLDIHGEPRVRTWTKVANTAYAGDDRIVAANDVDFRPGERIVISSSSYNAREAEQHVVAWLGADNRTIGLVNRLRFTHISGVYTIEGRRVDMRYEVGLMSRNVVIRGDDLSPRQAYGVHTICVGPARYRVENAEFFFCGQSGVLGRYCTHTHMSGGLQDAYVRSNSIHDSFQRSTTVHGSHHVRVQNNFAYNIRGHTFFVEDGNERMNVIEGNLAVMTQPLFIMLKSDTKPASFWTSSPENFWRHNVAAGCSHDGYWFELPGNPGGPSYTPTICPVHGAIGEFFNNTAHSNGVHGLRIYPVYLPLVDPCDDDSGPNPQYLYNFTAFHNGDCGIFSKEVGDVHHVGATLVENGGPELMWVKLKSVVYDRNPHIVDLLAVSSVTGTGTKGSPAVSAPQDEYFYASGITAVNYGNTGVLAACTECDSQTELKQDGYTTRWENVRFVNSQRRVQWLNPRKQIFWDLDGTLTGTPNAMATPFNLWNNVSVCSARGIEMDNGIVCPPEYPIRRLQIDGVNPRELDDRFMRITTIVPTSQPGNSNSASNADLASFAQFMANTNALSPVQASNVSAAATGVMNFRVKEIYGWVMPVVANTELALSHVSPIDFQTMRIRWSEPDYILATSGAVAAAGTAGAPNASSLVSNVRGARGEWSRLTFGHIDYRFNYEVTYGDPARFRPWLETQQPTFMNDFGTSAMRNNRVNNGSWSVVVTTRNVTWDSQRLAGGVSRALTMRVRALQCPREGCPLPPPVLLGNATRWSDPATWAPRPIPVAGENVIINSTMWVILDISPPVLGSVVINGKLEFEDNRSDLQFEAQTIVVHGILQVGTPIQPFTRNAVIRLYGDRTSPTAVVDNSIFLGNKVLAVFGRAELYGLKEPVTWTKLATTALPGDTTLQVRNTTGWNIGDRLVVTSTEYDGPGQTEEVLVQSVTSTTSVVVDRPLRFRHYAGTVRVNGTDITLAAAVGMLTRNVRIEGANPGIEGYGAHIVVADLPPAPAPALERIGSLVLDHVELRDCGKLSSEFASITAQFLGGTRGPTRVILNGCGISSAYNYGIVAKGTRGIVLSRNVISRAYRSAIDMDEVSTGNATITDNLVAAAMRAPDETLTWVVPLAAYYLAGTPLVLTGNVAAGSADAGFVFRPPPCTSPSGAAVLPSFSPSGGVNGSAANANSTAGDGGVGAGGLRGPLIANNEAHGVMIGAWIMPTKRGECAVVRGFTVWKCAHLGILSLDQTADLRIQGAVVSDSHIGISLNFVSSRPGSWSEVTDSFVLGSTPASTCNASLTCNAMTMNDVTGTNSQCGSVFGPTWRRIGIVMPQYLNRGKTCEMDFLPVCRPPTRPERLCGLPWEKRYGLPSTPVATFRVTNTGFGFFNVSECSGASSAAAGGDNSTLAAATSTTTAAAATTTSAASLNTSTSSPAQSTPPPITSPASVSPLPITGLRSVAFALNPSQPEYSPPVRFRGISWTNVEYRARISVGVIPQSAPECSGAGCDAQNIFFASDQDGSLTDQGPLTMLGQNPDLAMRSPACVPAVETWGALLCPGMRLVAGGVESLDPDRGGRRIGPVRVERIDDGIEGQNRTQWSLGPFNDGCAKRFEFGQFPLAFVPGRNYQVTLAGTNPTRMRFWFIAERPEDAVRLRVFYSSPAQLEVFVGSDQIAPLADGSYPSLASPRGANVQNPQERQLYLTMKGSNVDSPYIIRATAMVQLTMTMAISVQEFNAEKFVQNLATLLQIPANTIKVVNVRAGSVIADVQIKSNSTADPQDDSAHVAAVTQLQAVARRVVTLAQTGGLDVGYPVLSLSVVAPVASASDNSTSTIPDAPISPVLPPQYTSTPPPPPSSDFTSDTGAGGSSKWAAWKIAVLAVGVFLGVVMLGGLAAFTKYRIARANHNRLVDENAPPPNTGANGSDTSTNKPPITSSEQPIATIHPPPPSHPLSPLSQLERALVEPLEIEAGTGPISVRSKVPRGNELQDEDGDNSRPVSAERRRPPEIKPVPGAAAIAQGGSGLGFDAALPPLVTPTVGGVMTHVSGGPHAGATLDLPSPQNPGKPVGSSIVV